MEKATTRKRFSRFYRRENLGVMMISVLIALMGLINLSYALRPVLPGRLALLAGYLPLVVRHGSHLASALSGFALLLLAVSLARRKHTAWWLAEIILVSSAVFHLLKGLDYELAILSLGLAGLLLALRPHFHARSDPPSVRQGGQMLVFSLMFTLLYGAIGIDLLDRHYSINYDFWDALRQTVVMFTQFSDSGLIPVTGYGRYFAFSIYIVAVVTLAYAAFMLLRPVVLRTPATHDERQRAQAIVEAHGRTSLARMTLLDDKSYFFSSGGSVVAFVARGSGAVALGDPIGPHEDVPRVIAEFQDYCARNSWQPAFYQTRPDYLDHYRSAGFEALCVGQEGVVSLENFSLEGKENKNLRSGYNKLAKQGFTAQVFMPPLAPDLLYELKQISDEWLTAMHGSEKRFSVGWFDDAYLRTTPVMAVVTPQGEISAFANILTEFQASEHTVDLMRRRSKVENGTMDFLFASLMLWARQQGSRSFSLGLSALSGVGEHAQDPAAEKALHYIYEHINQFYNFKGLHEYKDKFHPRWDPRFLVFPGYTALPAIGFAMVQADSGEGFLVSYWKDYWRKRIK